VAADADLPPQSGQASHAQRPSSVARVHAPRLAVEGWSLYKMTAYHPSAQAAEGLLSSVTRKFRFGLKKNLRRLPPWEQVAAPAAALPLPLCV
jgi:hypothetical protein